MTAAALLVHAVVRAGHELPPVPATTPAPAGAGRVPGDGGAPLPVRLVTEGGVAAVVSEAPDRVLPRRRDLLAHQDLLTGLAEHGPVLPMRFGTVAPDEALVRRQLAAEESGHLEWLRRVDGRVEINVKAMPATDALAVLVRQDPQIRRLRAAAARHPGYEASLRLGEAVATALRRRATDAGGDVVRHLGTLAHEVRPGPEVTGCALNASFLVGRDAAGEFVRAAAEAGAARRDEVDLRVAGPLPCYSFTGASPVTRAGV
jgi:Gas vesicle synthesis protein GvpL/GvpF